MELCGEYITSIHRIESWIARVIASSCFVERVIVRVARVAKCFNYSLLFDGSGQIGDAVRPPAVTWPIDGYEM